MGVLRLNLQILKTWDILSTDSPYHILVFVISPRLGLPCKTSFNGLIVTICLFMLILFHKESFTFKKTLKFRKTLTSCELCIWNFSFIEDMVLIGGVQKSSLKDCTSSFSTHGRRYGENSGLFGILL